MTTTTRSRVLHWLRQALKLTLVMAAVAGVVYWMKFSPVPVIEHQVARGEIVAEVMGTGTLEAHFKSVISPRIAGRLKEVLVDQGNEVRMGELLVRLDDIDMKPQVEIAEAAVAVSQSALDRLQADQGQTQAILEQTTVEHKRALDLLPQNAISKSEADKITSDWKIAQAGVTRAEAAQVEARKQLIAAETNLAYRKALFGDTEIVAPFDGLIVRRYRDPGDIAVPGSPVLDLVSTKELWITAWVDETEMSRVAEGQPARVVFRSEPEESYRGEVARLGRQVDRETREFTVDVHILELPKNWAVGQRAEVYVETAQNRRDRPACCLRLVARRETRSPSPSGATRYLARLDTWAQRSGNRGSAQRPAAGRFRRVAGQRQDCGHLGSEDLGTMNLAAKDIQHNLGRFTLTTLGIGMLLMIVMGMAGIYRGLIEDATLLVERIGADLWVVQRDTRGPFAEVSRVPRTLVYRSLAVPGVKSAREFVFHTIQRQHQGKPLRMSVLGLSWPTDKGEWLPLVAGRPLARNHYEMVVDQTLGFRLHERIKLGKETYTVVGITRGMVGTGGDGMAFATVWDSQAIQFDAPGEAIRLERAARDRRGETNEVFIRQPALTEQLSRPAAELPAVAAPQLSAVVLRVAPGVNPAQVAAIVSTWGDVSVFTRAEQEELLVQGMVDKARRQLGMFRALLTIIAAIIMALILYTLTLDKLHSIALLKLIGAPNRVILGLILQQAIVLGGIGYGIAYLVGQKLFPYFPRRVVLTNQDLLQLALIVLGISVFSSLLGIWKAMRVEPNEALMG